MHDACPHTERKEGMCVVCGDCLHEVILNGVCFLCGTADLGPVGRSHQDLSPKKPGLIPADHLVRKK